MWFLTEIATKEEPHYPKENHRKLFLRMKMAKKL
jgi:hypothetical protein